METKIPEIKQCNKIVDELYFLNEEEKSNVHKRLDKLILIFDHYCNKEACNFQVFLYTYSVIEYVLLKLLKVEAKSKRSVKIHNFLPNNLPSKYNSLRCQRNNVHLGVNNQQLLNLDGSIELMIKILKYINTTLIDTTDLIILIHSFAYSDRNDLRFLSELKIDTNIIKDKYKKYINSNSILFLNNNDKKLYEPLYDKYLEILDYLFKEQRNISFWLRHGILMSLDYFDYENLKTHISSFSKSSFFYINCDDCIIDVLRIYYKEVTENILNNELEDDFYKDKNNYVHLLCALVQISNNSNISRVLETLLFIYEKSGDDQALEMASDMLWPSSPQTKAGLKEQFNAVCSLSDKITDNSKNYLLLKLLKGVKTSCTVYYFDERCIGIFEDGKDHIKEINAQYDLYLGLVLKEIQYNRNFLALILNEINSLSNDVIIKLANEIIKIFRPGQESIDDTIYIGLIHLSNMESLSNDQKNDIHSILEASKIDEVHYIINNIISFFNDKQTIHQDINSDIFITNIDSHLIDVIIKLDDPYQFGFEISNNYLVNNKISEIIDSLLARKDSKIRKFLKGYLRNNNNLVIKLLTKHSNDDTTVSILLLLKFDDKIKSRLELLSKRKQNIFWSNFSIDLISSMSDPECLSYIIPNLISVGKLELALSISSNPLVKNLIVSNKKIRSILINLLFQTSFTTSLDISYHLPFDGNINVISSNVSDLINCFDFKKPSKRIFDLEFILSERGVNFKPKVVGLFLQKSPNTYIQLLSNPLLLSLLNDYWDSPPGFKSKKFSLNCFNLWFEEFKDVKNKLSPNEISSFILLISKVYSKAPISEKEFPLRKDVIVKLNENNINWDFYSFYYIKHLMQCYETYISEEGRSKVQIIIKNNIKYLKENHFEYVADPLELNKNILTI